MSAPSFSSFPSFDSFPEPPKVNTTKHKTEDDSDRPRKKPRESKKDKHEHGASRPEKHSRHNRTLSPSRTTEQLRNEDERAHRKLHSSKGRSDGDVIAHDSAVLYFIDRRGDPLNIQYGRPHLGDIPKYRAVAGGRHILGLSHGLSVVGRTSRGVEVGLGGRKRIPELTDSATKRRLAAGPSKRIIPSADNRYKYDEIAGFLRLPTGRRPNIAAHRSIEKDDSNSDSSDSEEGQDEESDDEDNITLPAAQEQMRELERQVKADPKSIPAWMAILKQSLSASPEPVKNALQARADITLAVLGRAMSSHPSNSTSLQLRLRYIRAGELVWPAARLQSEWDTALRVVKSPDMVMEWLDWRIRTAKEGADALVQDGIKAMALMQDEEIARLRVFFRIATALKHAGYTERASAMFQAEAELIFSRPKVLLGLPLESLWDEFETFWDAEVPRLGEDGAKGWANWSDSDEAPPSLPAPVHDSAGSDPYTRWAEAELAGDRGNVLAHRKREDDDADPYATVLLSDISPLLFAITTAQAIDTFRKLWITFCGLHVPGFVASLSSLDDKWGITITCPGQLNGLFPSCGLSQRLIAAESHAGVLIGQEMSYNGAGIDIPVREWSSGVLGVLDTSVPSGGPSLWQASHLAYLPTSQISNILQACRLGDKDEAWDSITLSFEAAINTKRAVKLSKSYLAAAQDSASRWLAHARLERNRGKLEEARKVYETVLADNSALAKDDAAAALWWDWAEMEWLYSCADAAQDVILRAVGVTGYAGTSLLRGRRALEDKIAHHGSTWEARAAWIKLRALLELIVGEDAEVMLSVFNAHSDIKTATVQNEHLALASCIMLFHHSRTLNQSTRPALLRERSASGLALYPNNTLLLGFFLESERGQAIWGRLRQVLGANQDEKGILCHAAEIWAAGWNRNRWPAEVERVRSALNTAVTEGRTRGSPIMWRIYVELEIRVGELFKAKKVLYRAIADCPLFKELYLLAFTSLRKVFKQRELEDLAETMAERGIRMRTGLDEALVNWTKLGQVGAALTDSMDDYGEEDIEKNADDMRRLRPY